LTNTTALTPVKSQHKNRSDPRVLRQLKLNLPNMCKLSARKTHHFRLTTRWTGWAQ